MKILKASSFYPAYHDWIYQRHPWLKDLGYKEHHAFLMADGFATADSWKYYLERTGNFQVEEIVVNAEWLQKQWAKEQQVPYSESSWQLDIFRAQCKLIGADVLYALDHQTALSLECYIDAFPRRPFILGFDGVARHDLKIVKNCDLVITCLERSVDFYRRKGKAAYYMPHGFDTRRDPVGRRDASAALVNTSFIGSLMVRAGHEARACALYELSKKLPLMLWSGALPTDAALLRILGSYLRRAEFKRAVLFPKVAHAIRELRALNQGALFGRAMLSQLAASRITLNIHIAAADSEAANIRLFEATGSGACLVTDWKPNLDRIFDLDREIVAFKSIEEALEKINFLLSHERERAEIARRGKRRTICDYSVGNVIGSFGEFLRGRIL